MGQHPDVKLVVIRGLRGQVDVRVVPEMKGADLIVQTHILYGYWEEDGQLNIYPRPIMGRPVDVFNGSSIDEVALARARAAVLGATDDGLATLDLIADVEIGPEGILVYDQVLMAAITTGTFQGAIHIVAGTGVTLQFLNCFGTVQDSIGIHEMAGTFRLTL